MGTCVHAFAAATHALCVGASAALAAAPKKASAQSGGGAHTGGAAGSGLVGADGSLELGLSGFADLDTQDPTAAYVDLRVGYFVSSGVELGASVLQGTTPEGQRDVTGLFGEYDWLLGSSFVPFAGASMLHAAPPRGGDGKDGRILRAYGGLSRAVTPHVAVAVTGAWAISDNPVLGPEAARTHSLRTLDLGLRLYF